MKLLKTIRFDPSDTNVFEHAAEEGEWAISGGFCFSGIVKEDIKGKLRQAFTNGFLSLESFGFSTFASVHMIEAEELAILEDRLAQKFVTDFNAPSLDAAREVAKEEISYITDMCEKVVANSVFGLTRQLDNNNEVRERFRLIEQSGSHSNVKIWEIID